MTYKFAYSNFLLFIILLLIGFNAQAQNALHFDGTNDYVETSSNTLLTNKSFTIEFWCKRDVISQTDFFFCQGTASPNNYLIIGFRPTNEFTLAFYANDLNTPVYTDLNWHHWACTYNASNNLRVIYRDGIQVATDNPKSDFVGSGKFEIGKRKNDYAGVTLDELRVWNYARTGTEILNNMNAELCTLSPNLHAYYRFNSGIANGANSNNKTLIDDSGNGLNGTLKNSSLNGASSNWVTGQSLTAGITSSVTTTIGCNSYTWSHNGVNYTKSGVYSETLSGGNQDGCDSMVVLDLTIDIANDLTNTIDACDSYTWLANGKTYTTSIIDTIVFTTGNGCPYNYILNLNLQSSSKHSIESEACNKYFWNANKETYTISGEYRDTLTGINGCDSIITLNLTIHELDLTITNNEKGSFSVNTPNLNYQWVDCDNSYNPISGATDQSYTPTNNGNYAVIVFNGTCSDTSECISIGNVSTNQIKSDNIIIIPNPSNGFFTIAFNSIQSEISLKIYTISGKLIYSKNANNSKQFQVEIGEQPSGIYFIELTDEFDRVSHHQLINN